MRNINNDLTLKRNYLSKYRFLIGEYEQVKRGEHPTFRFAKDFYSAHDTDARAFLKYYNLFKQTGNELDLLPGKRGPKYGSRRPSPEDEQQVLELRDRGCNKFEINSLLKQKANNFTPSPSGVYNILKRHNRNRLKPTDREVKVKIIKERMGQLGHIDCHHLSKSVIRGQNRKLYLLCVLDDYSRLAWAQVMEDITALSTMFTAMHCMQALKREFGIQFEEIIADNGPEFGTSASLNKKNHPFERMLMETGIKRRYMKPYRPQTNGKVERFWRTLKEDLIEDTIFASDDFYFKGSRDSLETIMAKGRAELVTVTKEFETWLTVYYPEKDDTWVTLWYTEKWTDKTGKKDSLNYIDDVLLKNGKIVEYKENVRHYVAKK